MSGYCLHGCRGSFSRGNAGEDSGVGGSQRARMAHALHLRAEEIHSAVLECVAVDWDGLGGVAPRTKRPRDERLRDSGATDLRGLTQPSLRDSRRQIGPSGVPPIGLGECLVLDDCLRAISVCAYGCSTKRFAPQKRDHRARDGSALFLGKKVSFQEVRPSGRLRRWCSSFK